MASVTSAINASLYSTTGGASLGVSATQNLLQANNKTFIDPEQMISFDGESVSLSGMLNAALQDASSQFSLLGGLSGLSGIAAYEGTNALLETQYGVSSQLDALV